MIPNEYTNWEKDDLSVLIHDRCADLSNGETILINQLMLACHAYKQKAEYVARGKKSEQFLQLRKAFEPVLALWTEIHGLPVVGLNGASTVPLRHRVFLGGSTATEVTPYLRFLGDTFFEVGTVYPGEEEDGGPLLYVTRGEHRTRRPTAEVIACVLDHISDYWRPEAKIDL